MDSRLVTDWLKDFLDRVGPYVVLWGLFGGGGVTLFVIWVRGEGDPLVPTFVTAGALAAIVALLGQEGWAERVREIDAEQKAKALQQAKDARDARVYEIVYRLDPEGALFRGLRSAVEQDKARVWVDCTTADFHDLASALLIQRPSEYTRTACIEVLGVLRYMVEMRLVSLAE